MALRAWLQNVIYARMAPDGTSILQGPDARERSQLKAAIREVKAEMQWAMEQDWIQKAKDEPQKQYKSPTQWGPYERLYCAPEAYARFREKNMDAAPLQGPRANQMLAARPTEQGELRVVTGMEPWSYYIEPGRGIERSPARGRLGGAQSWPEGAPPVPEWS
eukprot:4307531-Pyramimonas_sp.AAC.1